MISLLGSQIWWTFETEDAFREVQGGNKHAVKDFAKKLNNQLADLTSLVRSPLSVEFRKKINTLMILDVHARDIIESFVSDSILNADDFAWESQLRFYWRREMVLFKNHTLLRNQPLIKMTLCRMRSRFVSVQGGLVMAMSTWASMDGW